MTAAVETMAYSGEVPWHGLGKEVPHDLTPQQMLEAAELDWDVTKIPCHYEVSGKQRYSGKQALVRSSDDRLLDIVTDAWNPMQNSEAFDFFHKFVMQGDMDMHTAGSLKGGQLVWALAKVKDSFELFGGDRVDSYMLFTNPHKFGQSIDVRFTPIRVVCNNTLSLSLSLNSNNVVKVTHRKEFDADRVRELMGVASVKMDQYRDMAELLGSKSYTKPDLNEYFKTVFPITTPSRKGELPSEQELSKNAALALEVIDKQPGHEYAPGTYWDAFNAVTYMIDHMVGREADTRIQSAWYGKGRDIKTQALKKAVEMAEAA